MLIASLKNFIFEAIIDVRQLLMWGYLSWKPGMYAFSRPRNCWYHIRVLIYSDKGYMRVWYSKWVMGVQGKYDGWMSQDQYSLWQLGGNLWIFQ